MRIRGKIIICTIMVIMLVFCGSVYANETSAIPSDTIHNIEEVNDEYIFGEPFKIGNTDAITDDEIAPRMGTGSLLFNMTWSDLGAGRQMQSQAGKTVKKSSFTNNMMGITSAATSTKSGTYKIGLAYYSSANDIYVIKKYAQFTANSPSTTKYVDVSGLYSTYTYWGCIVNNTSGVLDGTADILNYV